MVFSSFFYNFAAMTNDEFYMQRCIQLAANGIQGARPNPMVGAVIVAPLTSHLSLLTSKIIGEGYHVRCMFLWNPVHITARHPLVPT